MTPRALVATTGFAAMAGSEIVALEILEGLIARGFDVALTAHHIDGPIAKLAKAAGVTLLAKPAVVNPLSYDLAWFQTQIAPTMDLSADTAQRERTLCLFAHLDLKWNLAGPGILEELLADHFMYCSAEAAGHFSGRGLDPAKAWVFHNAAPAAFDRPGADPRAQLRKVLVVSNHAPDEVRVAADILRGRGVAVDHWGKGGGVTGQRFAPSAMDGADAVITIGKTVPYALRARVPVYVYDHLGGPGWLLADNFDACAHANFSGRCSRRQISAEALAEEVEAGFAQAAQAAAERPDAQLAPFALETHLDRMVAAISQAPTAQDRAAAMAGHAEALRRESQLAKAAGHYYRAWKRGAAKIGKLEAEIAKLRAPPAPRP